MVTGLQRRRSLTWNVRGEAGQGRQDYAYVPVVGADPRAQKGVSNNSSK